QLFYDGHLGGEQTEFTILQRVSWRPFGGGSLAFLNVKDNWENDRALRQYVHDGHLGGEQTEFTSSKEFNGGHWA
ncbi:2092_t:CDS:2, partial [Gigaspora margarita]